MRKILLISFLALSLTACDKGGGNEGGGGGVPAPRACVPGDMPYSLTVSGSFYSSSNNNCVATSCVSGYKLQSYYCVEDSTPGGGGETPVVNAPQSLQYTPQNRFFQVNLNVAGFAPSVLNCHNTTCTYTISGGVLPPGMSIVPASGVIQGLPTVIGTYNATVRVTNSAGNTTAPITIHIQPAAPGGLSISNTVGHGYYAVNLTRSFNIDYASGPGSVTSMSVSPMLPPGLSLVQYESGSNPKWRITGTPSSYSAKQTYTITATGTSGTATLNFELGVLNPPSNYSYNLVSSNPMSGGTGCVMEGSIPKCVFNKGQSFVQTAPTIVGDNLVYSVVSGGQGGIPATELPAGILLSAATGTFGTTDMGAYESTVGKCTDATAGLGYCLYTFKAQNELGQALTQVKIKINGDAPPVGFSYAGNTGTPGEYLFRELTNIGQDVKPVWVNNIAASCHGQDNCYTINPAVPNGFSWSTLTGRLQGSSDLGVIQAPQTYTITAHDVQGALTTEVVIEIKERLPILTYTQNGDYTLEKNKLVGGETGDSAPSIKHESGGGGVPDGPLCGQLAIKVDSFSISPALPAGLSLNTGAYSCGAVDGPYSTGGAITGTPNSLMEATTYTITGCNSGGCGTATITIEVAPKIIKVATGSKHACAIVQEEMNGPYRVMCWGQNDRGQLGFFSSDNCDGVNCSQKAKYVRMNGGSSGAILSAVEDITAGANHTCVKMEATNPTVYAGSRVMCWGANDQGQLGNGTLTDSAAPVFAKRSDDHEFKKVSSLSAGGNKTCLSGEITTPYRNANANDPDQYDFVGQIFCSDASTGKMVKVSDPDATNIRRVENTSTVAGYQLFASKLLTVGDGHVCAQAPELRFATDQDAGISAVSYSYDGVPVRIKCWGDNSMGQLGVSTPASSSIPLTVASIANGEVTAANLQLVAGGKHTCYLRDTTIKCWGSNEFGQLGRSTGGNLYDYLAAVIPMGSPNVNNLYNPGILSASAYSSSFSQLASITPLVNGVANAVNMVYTSGKYALSGAPYTGSQVTTPSPILDNSYDGYFHGADPLSVGASTQDFACASGAAGRGLRCWGANDKGQLSTGDTVNSVLPKKIKFNLN